MKSKKKFIENMKMPTGPMSEESGGEDFDLESLDSEEESPEDAPAESSESDMESAAPNMESLSDEDLVAEMKRRGLSLEDFASPGESLEAEEEDEY